MNFHIIVSLLFISIIKTIQQETSTLNILNSNNFKNEVLTRRVRSVIFPKKSFLLLTPAFVKAILDGRPRGLAYSIEFDMYSPLPDSIEGWKPTILINKIHRNKKLEQHKSKTTSKMPLPMSQSRTGLLASNEVYHLNSKYLSENEIQSYYYPLRKYDYIPNDHVEEFKTRNRKKPYKIQGYSKIPANHNYIPVDRFHQVPKLMPFISKTTNNSTKSKLLFPESNYDKWSSYGPTKEVYHSFNAVPNWKFQQSYRERREIFKQLEAVGHIFNINMKACIQRAMCEIATQLKPYGESLMEDIVRIILNISSYQSFEDDYNFFEKQHFSGSCTKHFAMTCPQSILEIFTKTIAIKK